MDLKELAERIDGRKIFVLGDIIFDKRIVGRVTKISPEAPVPMVEVDSESHLLGGAANVIKNLQDMGGKPSIATVIGDDPEGVYLAQEIEKMGIDTTGIFKERGRITTMVTRVLAPENYQLLRLERAENREITHETAMKLADHVRDNVKAFDAFLIADYGRGGVTQELVGEVVRAAKGRGKKIVVNPKKERFLFYEGVDVIRTNRWEASYATGVSPINETSIRIMGQKILSLVRCNAVLITWIEEGFHLFERDGKVTFIPPIAKRPLDVTGVGDAVTCALALGLAAGAGLEESARLANYAGSIVANKMGLATATLGEIKEAVSKGVLEVA